MTYLARRTMCRAFLCAEWYSGGNQSKHQDVEQAHLTPDGCNVPDAANAAVPDRSRV